MRNILALSNLKSLGGRGGSGAVQYLLKDTFSTNLAAGSVNGTQADIGGTRAVTDTNTKISITGGVLSFATGEVASDGIAWPTMARRTGQMLFSDVVLADTTGTPTIAWASTTNGAGVDALRFIGAGILIVANGTGSVNTGAFTATSYKTLIVQRAAGTFWFIKGGAFTNWTLLWHYNLGTTGTFPRLYSGNTTAVFTGDNVRVPGNLFLPSPLAYDTFTRSNGALGSTETTGPDSQGTAALAWTGSTFAVSSNIAVNTPATLSSELLADPGLESWTNATTPTSWTKTLAGTSSVNQETTTIHSGSNAARLDIDASGSNASLTQTLTCAAGLWFVITGWVRASASGKTAQFTNPNHANGVTLDPGTTYTQYTHTDRTLTINPTSVGFKRNSAISASLYFDDFSVKTLTTSELFASVTTSPADILADVAITQPAVKGIQAGVVVNLDSASNPQNFVLGYLDGYGNAALDKCVAGVYTNIISAAVTYAAGATLRVIKDGTTYQLFYNNAKVGSTSTVSDAGIISNVLHGLFSTNSGNTLDNFLLMPRGTNNEYSALNQY